VASAIHEALGSRPTVLPITPERVLECARSAGPDASR
jgi:CO/xanthine dehydrogenase Mo-binding subunit